MGAQAPITTVTATSGASKDMPGTYILALLLHSYVSSPGQQRAGVVFRRGWECSHCSLARSEAASRALVSASVLVSVCLGIVGCAIGLVGTVATALPCRERS